jgi:hypothetical protein
MVFIFLQWLVMVFRWHVVYSLFCLLAMVFRWMYKCMCLCTWTSTFIWIPLLKWLESWIYEVSGQDCSNLTTRHSISIIWITLFIFALFCSHTSALLNPLFLLMLPTIPTSHYLCSIIYRQSFIWTPSCPLGQTLTKACPLELRQLICPSWRGSSKHNAPAFNLNFSSVMTTKIDADSSDDDNSSVASNDS